MDRRGFLTGSVAAIASAGAQEVHAITTHATIVGGAVVYEAT